MIPDIMGRLGLSEEIARWYRWLQSRMEGTSWTMTHNYFKSPPGRVVDAMAPHQLALSRDDEVAGPSVGNHPAAR